MSVSLSSGLLQGMGFTRLADDESISGNFSSLHIYELQGITLSEPGPPPLSGTISGVRFRLLVDSGVNTGSQRLLGDILVDDELAWEKKHQCTAPYLLIHFGPTREHIAAGCWVKNENSGITTCEGFSEAREELRLAEAKALPFITTSIASAFNSSNHPVRFRAVDRVVLGQTADGEWIHDRYFSVAASGYTSTRLGAEEVQARLSQALQVAPGISAKVARFCHLALEEKDSLKRFLYFFLAIEVETHSVFSRIDHERELDCLLEPDPRINKNVRTLFQDQQSKLKSIRERFVWCAACVWTQLTDADVDDFVRLKKVRDDIAHGSIDTPPADSVRIVELLACKLQLL